MQAAAVSIEVVQSQTLRHSEEVAGRLAYAGLSAEDAGKHDAIADLIAKFTADFGKLYPLAKTRLGYSLDELIPELIGDCTRSDYDHRAAEHCLRQRERASA